MKITVINYGLSNLLSVRRALEHFGAQVEITGSAQDVLAAGALVLPGVGAVEAGRRGLEALRRPWADLRPGGKASPAGCGRRRPAGAQHRLAAAVARRGPLPGRQRGGRERTARRCGGAGRLCGHSPCPGSSRAGMLLCALV